MAAKRRPSPWTRCWRTATLFGEVHQYFQTEASLPYWKGAVPVLTDGPPFAYQHVPNGAGILPPVGGRPARFAYEGDTENGLAELAELFETP